MITHRTRPIADRSVRSQKGQLVRSGQPGSEQSLVCCLQACLADGTLVIWMTSHGHLCASWSTDGGKSWRLDESGLPFALDAGTRASAEKDKVVSDR